jgi:hypothetical protein
LLEIDGALVGVEGEYAGHQIRVDAASRGLAHGDLARAQREVVAPLDALGARVFPAPTLQVTLPPALRDAAIAAARAIDGVTCRAAPAGVSCELESGVALERFLDTAEAMFRAE